MKQLPIFEDPGEKDPSLEKNLQSLTHELKAKNKSVDLLDAIRKAQSLYISDADPVTIFKLLLKTLVEASESEFGFLDEVLLDENGGIFKKNLAMSDISWDKDSRELYRQLQDRGMIFETLENLAGLPALTGKTVISNHPTLDRRAKGLPQGHPSIKNFMGMPLYFGPKLVCVAGVANRQNGYTMEIALFLEPLLSTCASITYALQNASLDNENAKKLQDSELKYRILIQNFPNGAVLLFDHQLNILLADGKGLKEVGLEGDQMAGKTIWEIFPEETCKIIETGYRGALKGQSVVIEVPFSDRIYNVHFTPVENSKGIIEWGMVMTQDVTEIKNFERQLKISEERYRTIVETANEGIWVLDRESKTVFVNPKLAEMLGYEPGEMMGQPHADFLFSEDLEDNKVKKQRRQSGLPDVYERKYRKKNGDPIWVVVSAQPILNEKGEFNGSFGMSFDITDRKQAEDALKESERKYRTLFTNLSSGFALHEILLDENGKPCDYRFLEVNPAFEQLTGLAAEDLLGKRVLEVMPETEPYWIETYGKVAMTGESHTFENYSVELDKHYAVTAYCPEPGRFATLFLDITERKKVDRELIKLAEAVDQASEGIVITSTNGIIEYANPAFQNITGYSHGELLGRNPKILKSGIQDKTYYENLWNTLLSGNRWRGRMVNKRKGGVLYSAECSISPVKNPEGVVIHFVWVTRDITKELEMEKRMDQAQKMETIGSLAGGIAHDFNNLLFPILGMSEMLLEDFQEGDPNHDSIEEIYNAARRAGDLVKQILSFSRQSDHKKMPVKIQQMVNEALGLARSSIPSNIKISRDLQNNCGLVMADATQIHQIAMNLITNAYHAVEEQGGEIAVSVKESTPGENVPSGLALEPGRYVVLRVSDTGCGIDPGVIRKIFDPYFTTKPQGKGTGLGLSVVYGLVKDHQGDIRVTSVLGSGTAFEVFLPVLEKSPVSAMPEAVESYEPGTERILLVDDEKPVIHLEKQVLERLGYEVTSRTSSLDALELFKTNPTAFDLVITDMTMPNLTGDRLAKELLAVRADIPIIICTGFSDRINPEKAATMGIKGFLMKPVGKSDMARMIRKVLDSPKNLKTNGY